MTSGRLGRLLRSGTTGPEGHFECTYCGEGFDEWPGQCTVCGQLVVRVVDPRTVPDH